MSTTASTASTPARKAAAATINDDQVFVHPVAWTFMRTPYIGVELAVGEYDALTDVIDGDARILSTAEARRLGNALLNAANDAEQGA